MNLSICQLISTDIEEYYTFNKDIHCKHTQGGGARQNIQTFHQFK